MDVGFTAPGRGRTAGAGTGTVSRKRSRKGNDLEALNLRERLEFNYIRPLNPITLSRIPLSLSLPLPRSLSSSITLTNIDSKNGCYMRWMAEGGVVCGGGK